MGRLLRRFAPSNDLKEGTRDDEKEGKAFCNQKKL